MIQTQINEYLFKEDCEAEETDCSTSGLIGHGPYYQADVNAVATDQARLGQLEAQAAPQVAVLKAQITTLTKQEKRAVTEANQLATGRTGLIEREVALAQIEIAHPFIRWWVVFLFFAFIGFDLVPVLMKLQHVWPGDSPYEARLAAGKRHDHLAADRVDTSTRVERGRMRDQEHADTEFNRISIDVNQDKRIEDLTGSSTPSDFSRDVSEFTQERHGRIETPSLDDLVGTMGKHERQRIQVNRMLRWAGWVGAALIGALGAGIFTFVEVAHSYVIGQWLIVPIVILAGSLAAYTEGFRSAPEWALRAIFATLLAGLALPIFVIAINL